MSTDAMAKTIHLPTLRVHGEDCGDGSCGCGCGCDDDDGFLFRSVAVVLPSATAAQPDTREAAPHSELA